MLYILITIIYFSLRTKVYQMFFWFIQLMYFHKFNSLDWYIIVDKLFQKVYVTWELIWINDDSMVKISDANKINDCSSYWIWNQ